MVKFAWKPIMAALEAREAGIADALVSAEIARKELLNLKADNQKLLDEARVERDAMIKEAREIKEKMIADAKSEAQVQGAAMIESAKASIESEKNAAMAELKNQVAAFSIEIAEKVVRGELAADDKQKALAGKLAEEINLN